MPDSTRTGAEAAAVLGCDVAQIGKSIIFRAVADSRPVLVVASGAKRIDEARFAAALSGPITKADAPFVRHHTGFAIGGVAPIGHRTPPVTFLDRSLYALGQTWIAAGSPRAVFATTAAELEPLTDGRVITVD
ncbi:MAG: YbaK/EbsC family protein [Pseudomonadota bacterium]|nr:YbaK/EbsC family protein [Pseudomonadota bacterium]